MGDVRDPSTDQPLPIPNGRKPIVDQCIEDVLPPRKEHGIAKYGQALQAFNGRDPVQDAFEESVDLMLYLKQILEENAALEQYVLDNESDVWCHKCDLMVPVIFGADRTIAWIINAVRRHERESHPNG